MADSEEFRLKRAEHEERLSRVFDEVMGLGEFADSSRGSATSSRSSGHEESKVVEEGSSQEQPKQGEENGDGNREDERMAEPEGETNFPCLESPSPDEGSPFLMGTSEDRREESGGAEFDEGLEGLPVYGAEEEEDEDWHFALPMGTLEDADADNSEKRSTQLEDKNTSTNKPLASTQREEEREKDGEKGGDGNGSTSVSNSSQDHASENCQGRGVENQSAEKGDSQQAEGSAAAPVVDSNPPIPPVINIKDEPVDEGYDAALLPQSSIRQIKEELEHQEDELRISSVYSVGGGNTFVSPTVPAPGPVPQPAAIFIPGRGAVLQPTAMASLPLRPQPPPAASRPNLVPAPLAPSQPPASSSIRCSGCFKVLMKGQTAFQRKGSTQLFCSTICLTGHLPPTSKARACFQCHKEITLPKDMVMIPLDSNTYMHFCGQFCLSTYRRKAADKPIEKRIEKPPEKQQEKQTEKAFCSVCRSSKRIEHEVSHQGRIHRLCSDGCFLAWRKMRQLAMNCCEGCGLYCKSNSGSCQTLTIDRSQLNFCSPTCISTYKQTCRKMTECANCHRVVQVSTTMMERDQKGKIQLYCSSVCIEQSRPPRHTLTDAAFPCSQCRVIAVPQYHLAMVDGTIRNFCSYECVNEFRKAMHNSKSDLTNGTPTTTSSSSLRDLSHRDTLKMMPSGGTGPAPGSARQELSSSVSLPGRHPSHTSVPPLVPPYPVLSSPSPSLSPSAPPGQAQIQTQSRLPPGQCLRPRDGGANDSSRLTCHQCVKQFITKPLLFSYQGRMSLFCSNACCEQYKIQKDISAPCEHCKVEKVIFDVVTYNQQDLFFCSESCKLYFKHDLMSREKEHPFRPCSYCSCFGEKMIHSHYGGKLEEFCKPHCMSQFTVHYYGMARCDTCRKQGYMAEKLKCSGSVRNFCTLPCLLQYCYQHFNSSQQISSNGSGTGPALPAARAPTQPHHSSTTNSINADVVSLASSSASQPHVTADTALTGALPTSNTHGKNIDNASTQTDAMRVPVVRRRQMKNKSVLCRPFTLDQGILCQLPAPPSESTAQLASPSRPAESSAEPSTSASPLPVPQPEGGTGPCAGLPARLIGRHFLGKRETGNPNCKVCSNHKRKREEEEEGEMRKRGKMEEKLGESKEKEKKTEEREKEAEDKKMNSGGEKHEEKKESGGQEKGCEQENGIGRTQTLYFCKTCPGEPSLCPVPCFELYHTRLIYRPVPDLETPDFLYAHIKDVDTSQASLSPPVREEKVKLVMVPVAVPVFIPVPMNMYSQHTPVPMAMPLPVPVPIVIPRQNKEVKDAAVQSEPWNAGGEEAEKNSAITSADQDSNNSGGLKSEVVSSPSLEDETTRREGLTVQAVTECKEEGMDSDQRPTNTQDKGSSDTNEAPVDTQTKGSMATGDSPSTSTEYQPLSPPMMDLEADFPTELLDPESSAPQRGVKRPREGFSYRKRGRRRAGSLDRSAMVSMARSKLNYQYGVKAWKSWVQQCNRHTEPQDSHSQVFKEDVLQWDSTELSYGLCRFIKEVRRPNEEVYTPDSIFYLCLGIQQYLFEKGRIENIFTDELYSQFSTEITDMLRQWKPQLLQSCVVSSRVEEAFLWDCKQLGAYSPVVLLNTLLFFCTKALRFTTLAQHRCLSFANFTRHSRPCGHTAKAHYLRYQAASVKPPKRARSETECSKTSLQEEEGDMEMPENISNPLRCPVRLYEFYLSRCSESMRKRTDVFYLQPEQTVHTDSTRWFTSEPLQDGILQSMLTRILAVRELHQGQGAARQLVSPSPHADEGGSR
ncbi:zinc finger MYM-type protein 4-like [Lampris incognitus]|uniref:zinc finger MYM-type protein 4-like n=1 Tax=Lampris incognitus TaxID=2546036 RepID=UPI0024B53F57|nr:zinc finger MYM-type protein 4-like [Lampris incognitus]